MFSRIALLFFGFCIGLGFQARAFDVPNLTGPVIDQVGLLTPTTQAQLSELFQQAHQNKGPQIQILIVDTLQGLEIEDAAIRIFDKWKLGGEKEDNGLLFLIAPKEKKLRIEVGRGLEGDIPDVIAKRIISDIVVPFFKRGEFEAGVVQGVQSILYYSKAQFSGQLPQAQEPPQESRKKDSGGGAYIFLVILALWILLFIFNPTLALALLFSGRGGGGGGSGGGSGWSGGGGSSAGGGASGSW